MSELFVYCIILLSQSMVIADWNNCGISYHQSCNWFWQFYWPHWLWEQMIGPAQKIKMIQKFGHKLQDCITARMWKLLNSIKIILNTCIMKVVISGSNLSFTSCSQTSAYNNIPSTILTYQGFSLLRFHNFIIAKCFGTFLHFALTLNWYFLSIGP